MTGSDCTFCAIARGAWSEQVIYQDESTVAFLDIAPATRGHTLVIPRVHAADIFSITEPDAAAVMRTVRRTAIHLDRQLQPDGMSIFQSNRAAGWQDVFHLHVHLVPRYVGDDLTPPWGPTREQPGEIRKLAKELRSRL